MKEIFHQMQLNMNKVFCAAWSEQAVIEDVTGVIYVVPVEPQTYDP